jgi:hypothetical protein
MFKQIIFLFFIVITLSYFIIKHFLVSTHKLYFSELKLKYTLHGSDKDYLDKYSQNAQLFDLKKYTDVVFYTHSHWDKRNYIKYNKRYYIIEPGYYYYITKKAELFLQHNCKIKLLVQKK